MKRLVASLLLCVITLSIFAQKIKNIQEQDTIYIKGHLDEKCAKYQHRDIDRFKTVFIPGMDINILQKEMDLLAHAWGLIPNEGMMMYNNGFSFSFMSHLSGLNRPFKAFVIYNKDNTITIEFVMNSMKGVGLTDLTINRRVGKYFIASKSIMNDGLENIYKYPASGFEYPLSDVTSDYLVLLESAKNYIIKKCNNKKIKKYLKKAHKNYLNTQKE